MPHVHHDKISSEAKKTAVVRAFNPRLFVTKA